MNAALLK